jgi:hypothetical protein
MKNREIGTKRKNMSIPVVVLDLKTKESYEYLSITEAARSFDTHPKTIWRIVYFNKLYLNRYQITEKRNKELSIVEFVYICYKNVCNYFYKILLVVKSNKIFIYRRFLVILFWLSICIFIIFLIIIFKDIYHQYIFALRENRVNFNRCIWEHRYCLYHALNNNNIDVITYKTNFINIKEWRFEYIFNNKWASIHNINNELGIYQSIVNAINIDFNAKGNITFSRLNSAYSSPLIERVNINSIFSNAIASTSITNEVTNSLGIQGINFNRNSIILGDLVINTKVKTTELLNYQSNILYCLINGLSPSIY